MISDHSSATVIYVVFEEGLWNVRVLQRVHLFSLWLAFMQCNAAVSV